MSWQRVPIGYASLKQLLRNGLKTNDSRNYWWPILTGVKLQAAINEYPDVIGAAEKLHVIISEPLLDHKSMSKIQPTDETELIESVSKNLLYVLKRNKKIEETEYFVALTRILVKELRRIDVCYMIASSLLENQEKYCAVSYEGNRYNSFAFKEMVKAYLPKTYLSLTTIGALDEKYLNLMFVDFFVEILPENLVLRIVDAYLLEGVKVLYRFGLGLIKGYKSLIKTGKYETAKDFWVSVKADAISIAISNDETLLFKTLGLPESLPAVDPFLIYSNSKNREFLEGYQLITNAYEVDRSYFSKMVRPMNVSKNNIKVLKQAAEENLSNKLYDQSPAGAAAFTSPGATKGSDLNTPHSGRHRSSISETVIGGRSSNHLEIKSSNFSSNNQKRLNIYNSPGPGAHQHPHQHSPVNVTNQKSGTLGGSSVSSELTANTLSAKSSILDAKDARSLISLLPESVVLEGLELAYSPSMHGWGLPQLYSHVRDLTPTVLVLRLLAPFEEVVLGAFLAETIKTGRPQLGDGTAFVFRIDSSRTTKFEWAGLSGEAPSDCSAAMTLFAAATESYLLFGSSSSAATAAIRLDQDLKAVYLGPSDTYNNPVLVDPAEKGDSSAGAGPYAFPIKELEVFCGTRSVMLSGHGLETSMLSDSEADQGGSSPLRSEEEESLDDIQP